MILGLQLVWNFGNQLKMIFSLLVVQPSLAYSLPFPFVVSNVHWFEMNDDHEKLPHLSFYIRDDSEWWWCVVSWLSFVYFRVGGFCHDTTCLVIAKSIKLQGAYTIIMFFNHLYIGCNTNTNMNSVRRDVVEKINF